MSNPFGAAGGIKSIQRGVISCANTGTGTVTITAVDTGKAVLHVHAMNGYEGNSTSSAINATMPKAVLTNATTITWNGGTYGASNGSWSGASSLVWQLVEYQ